MNVRRMVQPRSLSDNFRVFILEKQSEGCAIQSLESYIGCLYALKPYMDIDMDLEDVTKEMIVNAIAEISKKDVSRNTVRHYSAGIKAFFGWCNKNGYSDVNIPLYKGEESVPETYTDEELKKLLKRPNLKKCSFTEYRTWVMVNLLVNNGCRASTLCNIQIRDFDAENGIILTRHMKRRKNIQLPLGPQMTHIICEYLVIRNGRMDDWLFCNENGSQMCPEGLKSAIERYNKRRGVERTGVHKFRNTFARIYLVECKGDALKLQKLLGHSTLDMTKHYVKLFNTDLINDYNEKSPLDAMTSKCEKSAIKMR